MRIAFDLDNTLIRCGHDFALETPKHRLLARLLGGEGLRRGIVELCRYCRAQNWEVWVYTTSYRSAWYIRRLFWLHGIGLDGIVNQARHRQEVRASCSKHPPTFGIELLVDDAAGVAVEAERFGFRTVIIRPDDEQWAEQVRTAVSSAKKV